MPPQSRNAAQSSCRAPEDQKMALSRPQKTKSTEPSVSQRSVGSANNSVAAPSSVYLAGSPLTRDLSDLSGSYVNGSVSRSPKNAAVPAHIFDPNSFKGPWRHAYVLSQPPPPVPINAPSKDNKSDSMDLIFMSQNDGVEIVDQLDKGGIVFSAAVPQVRHNRVPIVILLMDTARKIYELMQLWVDKSEDSVRDVVHTLQQAIPESWKQDYDGLFQMRGNKFSQLIHILRLEKYDVQPREIWIAKPWSMTAKVT